MAIVAERSHATPLCTVFVYPRETSPEELLELLTEMQVSGIPAEGWHPWWGGTTRVQKLVELSTGASLDGHPFVVTGTVRP